MQIRKFILSLFIVFALSFSFQPVSIYAREREAIIHILNFEKDDFTNDFIKQNETSQFYIRVSLTLQIMIRDKNTILFNTS